MATHVITPGASSDAVVTGTKPDSSTGGPDMAPRPPHRSGRPGGAVAPLDMTPYSVQLETEQSRRVLRGDLARVPVGHALEHAVQEVAGFRPRRLRVREVTAPQHRLDADRVAQLNAEVVLH